MLQAEVAGITGEPKLKCDQDEFTESQTLRGPNGSFGSIFMSERIEDGLPVVLKMLKQDERSSESEILLEICMHEVYTATQHSSL